MNINTTNTNSDHIYESGIDTGLEIIHELLRIDGNINNIERIININITNTTTELCIGNRVFNIHNIISEKEETIKELSDIIIKSAYDICNNKSIKVSSLMDILYLRNIDIIDESERIKNTINDFKNTGNFDDLIMIGSIVSYSKYGNNTVFNNNLGLIDAILKSMVMKKIKKSIIIEYIIGIIESLQFFNNNENMEDIKMIMKEEDYENKISKEIYKTYTQKQDILELDKCMICLDKFDETDIIDILPCKHIFHTKCNKPWLTKHSYKCSYCKTPCCDNPIPNEQINE